MNLVLRTLVAASDHDRSWHEREVLMHTIDVG
jgi:hypothetical protein